MNDEKTSGFGAPGPDSFDLDAYISGVASFPKFKHTLYLDQKTGIELNTAYEEKDASEKMIRELKELRDKGAEAGTMGLADNRYAELTERIEAEEAEVAKVEIRIKELEQVIVSRGLTLHFQVGNASKLGSVVRKAERAYEKKNGKGASDDIEYITGKTRAVILAQLGAYCIGTSIPTDPVDKDGDPVTMHPAPSEAQMEKLIDGLISSEMVRLMIAVNKGLENSSEWSERVDAGFPGGSSHLGSESLGGARAEDGAFLGGAAS